ncbi:type II secretion system F family protein [Sporolactobacillus terrae]|uniref:Type II secretion system F family protein n=1 Tax=Sporolactobacillus terrae TaxID=269673 RepID=A0ABX5Q8D0_9BACL|nr:type II secretion system F family protein [Sporolactobacillus terrae]QAA22890.1 type II secretion system F family protein [Sporolactobacillus terrae]QAA25863.1 type II secretion system F family protein [Sporolactobacillus terrae]UAK17737.1 type II secretion system F family protein [Sporolactobacillus terrae]
MPLYDYIGTTAQGKVRKGRLSAVTRQEALLEVAKQGLTIRSVHEHKDSIWYKELSIGQRVKLQDKVVFLRQFATIIKAGVTVADTLEILTDQEEKNKYFKQVIMDMAIDLREGQTLSQAFENQSKIFSPMIIHMIRAGEESGRLEESLDHLATYYERLHKSRQKLTTAMVYPAFVFMMSIGVVLFLLTTIIPMFRSMFASLNTQLPMITRVILGISDWLRSFWYTIILLGFAIIVGIFILLRNKSSKLRLDYAIIRLPLIGQIVYKGELSRLLWMLALLLSSSVPVIDALHSIEKITSNLAIRQAIHKVAEALDFGRPLSEAFQDQKIFPAMIHHMTAIGEKTGMLDQMLNSVAKYYEDDVEQMTERMKVLIEPLVILFLAVVVGFIVLAIIIPMFQIYQNV